MAPTCSGVRLAKVGVAEGLAASMELISALAAGVSTGFSLAGMLAPPGPNAASAGVPLHDRRAHALIRHARNRREAPTMWPNRRLMDLFKIEHPILLAPMAGAMDFELAVAVAEGGGLGVAALRHADAGPAARAGREIPRPDRQAGQSQFFLSHAAGAQQRARGRLARAAQALLPRAWRSIRRRRSRPATARRSTRRSARWSRS